MIDLHGSADDRGAEATGGGVDGGRCGAGSGGAEAQDLHLEGEVWRHGSKSRVLNRTYWFNSGSGHQPKYQFLSGGSLARRLSILGQVDGTLVVSLPTTLSIWLDEFVCRLRPDTWHRLPAGKSIANCLREP